MALCFGTRRLLLALWLIPVLVIGTSTGISLCAGRVPEQAPPSPTPTGHAPRALQNRLPPDLDSDALLAAIRWLDNPASAPFESSWLTTALYLMATMAILIVAVLAWNRMLQSRVTRRTQEITVLNQVIAAASSTMEPAAILDVSCRALAGVVNSDRAVAALSGPTSGEFTVIAENIPPDQDSLIGRTFSARESPALDKLIENPVPLRLSDVRIGPFEPRTGKHRLKTLLLLPMMIKGRVKGVICLASARKRAFSPTDISIGTGVAAVASQALESAQLFQAQKVTQQQSETLREIARELNLAPHLDAALDLILSHMKTVIAYDSGSIMLLDKDHLRVVALRGFQHPERVLGTRFELQEAALNRQVVETKEPLIIASASELSSWIRSMDSSDLNAELANIHSWMGIPLLFQDQVIGMLTADKVEPNFYTPADAELALAFADHAAVAIERARLLESERAQLQLARTLQRVGALLTTQISQSELFEQLFSLLARIIQYDSVGIQLLDHSGNLDLVAGRGYQDLESARRTTTAVANMSLEQRWGEEQVVVIPDTHRDPRWKIEEHTRQIRSWVGAALRVKGELIGILNVDSSTLHAYDESSGQTVASFANQAAIAIENVRLSKQTQRELAARQAAERALKDHSETLSLLYEASHQLSRTLDLNQIYQTLFHLIQQVMCCDTLWIASIDAESEMIHSTCCWHLGTPINVDQIPSIAPHDQAFKIQRQAIQSGRPRLIKDLLPGHEQAQMYPFFDQHGPLVSTVPADTGRARSAILAPITLEDQVIGLIQVTSLHANAYDESHLRTLSSLTPQIAAAQANASLYQQAQHEIVERKRTERQVEERRVYLEGVLAAAPDAIVTLDAEHRILEWNKGAVKLFGYSRQEAVGKNLDTLIAAPDGLDHATQLTQRVLRGEEIRPIETIRYRKDKTPVNIILAGSPMMMDGELIGVVAVYTDITSRVQAEGEIRQRAAQQAALNAIIADATAAQDIDELLAATLDHLLCACEQAAGAIWLDNHLAGRGLTPELTTTLQRWIAGSALPGRFPLAVADWEQVTEPTLQPLATSHAQAGQRASIVAPISVDGRLIGGLCVASPPPQAWSDEQKALLDAVGQQLGNSYERLRLVDRIRAQIRQVHQIVDAVPEGVMLLSQDNHIILANPAARSYLDLLTDAQIGDRLLHLGSVPLDQILDSDPDEPRWHEVQVASPPQRVFEVVASPLESGQEVDNDQGQNGSWVLVIHDISREREIQQRVQIQERMAAVGQLAAGIAHDFNNIMAVIVLYSQLSLRTPNLDPKVQERIRTILKQSRRASDLIQQILDFGRQAMLERHPLDLRPFLKEQVKLLERTLPENIQIEMHSDGGEYVVDADPTRIQQMIMNLALNARDAMPDGGQIRLALDRVSIDAETPHDEALGDGEWIKITVADSGHGISKDILPRIFEPFFTTKAPRGTGLGLAQVYGIVRQHDGHTFVESSVGEGTTFAIYLPALPAKSEESSTPAPANFRKGHQETILVVEDDPATRQALLDSLKVLDYRPLQAGNGREALEIIAQHQHELALIISDLVMPEMGGLELFRALRERYPHIKTIALTGHSLMPGKDPLSQEVSAWIQKPIHLEELADVIGRTLGYDQG